MILLVEPVEGGIRWGGNYEGFNGNSSQTFLVISRRELANDKQV